MKKKFKEEYFIPSKVSLLETIIYDWVYDNYSPEAAEDPIMGVEDLADYLRENLEKDHYKQIHQIKYRVLDDDFLEQEEKTNN